jgi:diguanylate cyclase (GGDEF)-like protein
MIQHCIGSLVVVDESGQMVGILTERDCLSRLADSEGDPRLTQVNQIMMTDVAFTNASAPLSEVNKIMVSRHIRHLPIVVDGRPVGMLSSRDLLGHQLRLTREIAAAAEQTARLVKCLKSLDVEDVILVIHQQVPEMFAAQQWVLGILDDQGSDVADELRRSGCACPDQDCWQRGRLTQEPVILPPCSHCGRGGVCIRIPLSAAMDQRPQEQAGDFLCMCGIEERESSKDVLFYKARLLEDVLSATLANARLYKSLRQQSLTDPLTGANNRLALKVALADVSERAARYGRPFCLAILDIDHFKAINDSHGHSVGDQVLRQLSDLLRTGIRNVDVCARYGGDEFVILLPEVTLSQARVGLERIRAQVDASLLLPDGRPVTFSCGLAEWCGGEGESGDTILRRADGELYEAKDAGRNCIRPDLPTENWSQLDESHFRR